MNRESIEQWLREDDSARLDELWRRADAVRRENVGDEVHLRGLLEISNHCVRECLYCGLRRGHDVSRYRMSADEILDGARRAASLGYGTVVMQAGEDYGITAEWMADVICRLRTEETTGDLAVTLSLGERSDEELALWREAGANRYLLRFETSRRELYEAIHPPLGSRRSDRIAMLHRLRDLGYEIGSGVMIGLPGQTYADLAADVAMFGELGLDMIGVGPFLAHPDTPLGQQADRLRAPQGLQVPATEEMTYKVLALTRLVCPRTNLPSTTALATLNQADGRELGLVRGANVVMPNVTPPRYRALYEIYPAKACLQEQAGAFHRGLLARIASIGRTVGTGRGDSPHYTAATRTGSGECRASRVEPVRRPLGEGG